MNRKRNHSDAIHPARRGLALLAGFLLLVGGIAGAEEEVDLGDLLDLSELDEEDTVEILPPDATLLARDKQWHTPAEGSLVKCDHEVCYWTTPMGYTDEAAVWKVLTQPVTVLDRGRSGRSRTKTARNTPGK